MDETYLKEDTADSSANYLEKLQMENELLRMKIMAEFGGVSGEVAGLPPEIENQFLKHVIAFEKQYSGPRPEKVSAMLGNPVFQKENELDDVAFANEWKRLNQLLQKKFIDVGFIRPRDDRFRYRFITEELFQHETDAAMFMPGMTCNFIYEEFHPDHEQEITDRAIEFLASWFDRKTEPMEWGILSDFVRPDTAVINRDEIIERIQLMFDAYTDFDECTHKITEVKFELRDDEEMQGIGHVEGALKYYAHSQYDGVKCFEGPFKLYLSREHDWWSIFYFVMPGFNSSE